MTILTLTISVLVLLFLIQNKVYFYELRDNTEKKTAEIVEFRFEKGPFRNDYTLLKYPYVKIISNNLDETLVRLKYANNWTKPFEIGEKVEVFWCGTDLLYWNAYNKGLWKLLPSNWNLKWKE